MPKEPSSSSTNTPAESSTPATTLSNTELDRLLNREASAIQRELEVDRILNAFKLKYVFALPVVWVSVSHFLAPSPYDIFDLEPSATPEDIKRKYRQLSLCERPFLDKRREVVSLMRDFLYVLND
jgi:DnaJ family protein C protein 8